MIYPPSESKKPILLFISHVIPLNPSSGQQQRVLQMITEGRKHFNILFLTFCSEENIRDIQEKMNQIVDKCIFLPSIYNANLLNKALYSLLALLHRLRTGLKKSNYLIGQVELTNKRISKVLKDEKIDLVIYEYWHAWKSADYFKNKRIPVLLDMHDILSNAYVGQLDCKKLIPKPIKKRFLKQYNEEEHNAWEKFDGIITINEKELEDVKEQTKYKQLFFCPMGIDLTYWKYSRQPANPPRFGFYGGLGSPVNQRHALFTIREIMPKIWAKIPNAEIWLVGSNPNKDLLRLASEDIRIKVTGYLEDPRLVLSSLTAVFCPWEGVFGFRSRIVEVMALGVPIIASPDAVAGMGFNISKGLYLAKNENEFAERGWQLIFNQDEAIDSSKIARSEVVRLFSHEATYGVFFKDLQNWIHRKPDIS